LPRQSVQNIRTSVPMRKAFVMHEAGHTRVPALLWRLGGLHSVHAVHPITIFLTYRGTQVTPSHLSSQNRDGFRPASTVDCAVNPIRLPIWTIQRHPFSHRLTTKHGHCKLGLRRLQRSLRLLSEGQGPRRRSQERSSSVALDGREISIHPISVAAGRHQD
jgi:hypothetical protein